MRRTSRIVDRVPFFYGWVIVAVSGLNMFAGNVMGSIPFSLFIKPMEDEFDWSRTLISGAILVGNMAVIVVAPLAGYLADRYGPRVVLTVSSAIMGAAAVGLSQVDEVSTFYLAFGMGRALFFGSVQVATVTAVANWFIRRRGRAMAVYMMAPSISFILLPLITQTIISLWGWRVAWLALGIMAWGLTILPSYFLLIRRPEEVGQRPDGGSALEAADMRSRRPEPAAPEPQWTLGEAVRTPTLWLVTAAASLLLLSHGGVQVHLVAYLVSRGLSSTAAAVSLSFMGAGMGVGILIWGNLADRFSVKPIFTGVALVSAGVIALLLSITSMPVSLGVSALLGWTIGGMGVMTSLTYANYFGRHSLGAIRGFIQPFLVICQAVGVLLSGIIFDTTGSYTAAFVIFVGLSLVATMATILARPPVKRGV